MCWKMEDDSLKLLPASQLDFEKELLEYVVGNMGVDCRE